MGTRGEALRAQLAAKHPERTREEIEDAIQTACERFVDEADGITAPGQVYRWIRTVAHRSLNRERERLERQIPVDPFGHGLVAIPAETLSPEQQVIAREDEVDLAALTELVASALPERQRDVLALYGAGHKRHQIAAHLGISHRTVKRDLLEILDQARAALARLAGGGCERGEWLVVRLACGFANPVELSRAQLHLARCPRCQQLHERMNLWREKIGATLPIPASERADSRLLERALHKALDTLGTVRQHVADGGTQIKQQAATAYYRMADPTPLAGARPGAVAAVVAGCLAVGTGAYTCVKQTTNQPGARSDMERQAQQQRDSTPRKRKPTTETANTQQTPPPPAPTPVVSEPVPNPQPAPPPMPPPEPVEPAPQPPPEQSFEPSSPAYSPSASPSSASPTPAPVADGGGSSEFEP